MRQTLIGTALLAACIGTAAAAEDIVPRGMGSFHVGARIAKVFGQGSAARFSASGAAADQA